MRPFPIILALGDVNDEIYGITGAFVRYVNDIAGRGLAKSVLPHDFLDLYALDNYYWQVWNGGHCQFIANSDAMLGANLDHALRGSEMLAMPELAQLLMECRGWCDANPEERDSLADGMFAPKRSISWMTASLRKTSWSLMMRAIPPSSQAGPTPCAHGSK